MCSRLWSIMQKVLSKGARFMPTDARYQTLLETSPLFAGLGRHQLEEVLHSCRPVAWKKGPVTLDTLRCFYIIVKGRLEVMRQNSENGRVLTLFLLVPGDGFDVLPLLDDRPHEVMTVALDAMEALSLPISRMRHFIERYPVLSRNLLLYLAEKLRQLETLAADIALYETVTRLARLILRHADPEHAGGGEVPVRLIGDLPHEVLAHMIGSVRAVVNRHLQAWKRKGIASVRRGHLAIRDLEALYAQSHGFIQRLEGKRPSL